jgi:TPR repeat protein
MRRRCFSLVAGAALIVGGLILFAYRANAKTQIDEVIERAQKGEAESQFELGQLYRHSSMALPDGSTVDQDSQLAIRWLRKAAEQDLPLAQYALGEFLYQGDETLCPDSDEKCLKPDEVESARWLSRFLKHADLDKDLTAQAEFMLAMEYQYNYECDPYWDRKRPGDTTISLSISCGPSRFPEVRHLTENYDTAAKYLRSAAEAGYLPAQYQLARMYQSGSGVPQDYEEAAKWYRSAAEADSDVYFFHKRDARGPLGKLYVEMGDYVSAHMWFNLATMVGDPWAREERDEIAKRMTPAQIAEAQKLAREWVAKHKK